MSYSEFLARKARRVPPAGLPCDPEDVHPRLHGWQRELTLALKEMVGQVEPGGRIDSSHLVVEWPLEDIEDDGDGDEALGTPGEIRILFHLADVDPEARS